MKIGEAICLIREKAGLSKYELARRTGLMPINLTQIERGVRGNLTLKTLHRIAQALSVKPHYLVFIAEKLSETSGEELVSKVSLGAASNDA